MKLLRRALLALVLSAGLAPAGAQVPPPVPALPDLPRQQSYSISASTCACAINFALYGDSTDYANWIQVFVNGVRMTQSGNWTITSPSGPLANISRPVTDAVLTFAAPQTGTVTVVGARRPRRTSQWSENAPISARNLNLAFSDLVAMARETWDKINDVTGRTLASPPGNAIGPLPPPAACVGRYLGFDATGLNPKCSAGGAGSGNVVGPSTSVSGQVAVWDATDGTLLKSQPLPTLFDTVYCNTVGYAIFRFTGTWKCSRSVPLDITWFDAVADNGTTNNTPLIQAAYDYAAANGLAIKIPRSNGYFGASCGRNNAMIDGTSLTVANGNKSVSIYGDGWSEKPFATPTGSWILPRSDFPNTCSYIRLSGSDKVASTVYDGFGIGEFGGSLGTPKGLHGIFIDASNPAYYQQNMRINNVFIGNTAAGYSIKCTTGSAATPGCIPDSSITNSKFMSFNADYLADHVTIGPQNTIGQNTTLDSRNVGIEFAQCNGCTSVTVVNNNFSNANGMVVAHGANKLVVRDNEMELSAGFTNTRGAMIDLVGDVVFIEGASVTGNQLAQGSLVGDYAPVRVANVLGAQIYDNRIGLAKATAYDYVTVTGSAGGTFIGYNRCSYANASSTVNDLSCTISSRGPNGFQYTPFGFILPGTSSSETVVKTSPVGNGTVLIPSPSSPSTDTLALLANAQTLTNKTISGASNTLSNIGNSSLTNSATTVNGQTCTLGSTCTVSASASSMTVGATLISGGATTRVLYDNAGVLGEYLVSGTGSVAMNTAPAITGGSHDALTSLGIRSTGAAFDLKMASAEVFTGNHTLTWSLGNADRTLTLGGNATLNGGTHSGTNTGDQTITLSGDVSGSGTGAITALIGATKVTSAMLNADVFSTAHSWGGVQTLASPVISGAASGNNTLPIAMLGQTAANTVMANVTSGTANWASYSMSSCSTSSSAVIWTTNTGFGCNTSIAANTATTATTATNATNTAITDDTATNATVYPTWVTASTGNLPQKTSSSKLSFNPSTGVLSVAALTMQAGAGAFTAGSGAASGTLTSMLLNGGSAGGSYMAFQAGATTYAYVGDSRAITGAANDDFLIQAQSGDGFHVQTGGSSTDRFAITSAGLVTMQAKMGFTGTAPALTSCGTTPAIAGTDSAGEVTMGTASPTGCVITFNAAYPTAPYCTVTWQANLASMQYTTSTTTITLVQTATSSNKVNYNCVAR